MKHTILIVDDMRLNIDALTEILNDKYTLMVTTSGEKALTMLGRKIPDLILMDVYMPEMDGFEVVRRIKLNRDLSNIPIIFVTGEQDNVSEEMGLKLGAVDYIKKPYNADIVKVRVRNHLELKVYRDDLEMLVDRRTHQLEASRDSIIMGMSLMAESHDKMTGEHICRIRSYTGIICKKMLELYPDLMTEELAAQIELYSPLHDVGKISISDAIINKPQNLTPEEFEIMKTHTINGAELLQKTDSFMIHGADSYDLKVAIEIAGFHHEKYDGTGYPDGMKGDEIPLPARITALADAYDVIRSERPYKAKLSHRQAVKIIKSESASHFDPYLVSVFEKCQDEMAAIEYN
jgi:putative two-component system response regulator